MAVEELVHTLMRERDTLQKALQAIAAGERDAQVIAKQTLNKLKRKVEPMDHRDLVRSMIGYHDGLIDK